MDTTTFNRPTDDQLIARSIGAYLRDGGTIQPSMQASCVLEYAKNVFIEVRCPKGELLAVYKHNEKSGRLRKQ